MYLSKKYNVSYSYYKNNIPFLLLGINPQKDQYILINVI